jgi:hypothetical protein
MKEPHPSRMAGLGPPPPASSTAPSETLSAPHADRGAIPPSRPRHRRTSRSKPATPTIGASSGAGHICVYWRSVLGRSSSGMANRDPGARGGDLAARAPPPWRRSSGAFCSPTTSSASRWGASRTRRASSHQLHLGAAPRLRRVALVRGRKLGAIPKHLRNLRAKLARLVLPPRRARTYPRAVKVKMSSYPRKRPSRRRKLVK